MPDVSKRARDAAGAAADRLRRAVEGSPLGGLFEEQQRNLNELLAQVQNAELRAKLTAMYDQQQQAFFELAHTVQNNMTAQQQHMADLLTTLEDTVKARRAQAEAADPLDDLSDEDDVANDEEPPRAAPFADVPAAQDAPAGFAPPLKPVPPAEPAAPAAPADSAATEAPGSKKAGAKKPSAKKAGSRPKKKPAEPQP